LSNTFEPGEYRGSVTRWALVKAKNEKKTPQLALSFIPLGRVDPANPDGALLPCPEVERTVFRSITEKTAKWLLQDLKDIFEYPFDTFAPLDPDNADGFDFHDREFTAVVKYEEYEGKDHEKWNFGSGVGFNGDPLNPAEIRRLDTLFGAAKPKRARRPAATPVTAGVDAQPVPEQNVPF
jgi:hypothetical protein